MTSLKTVFAAMVATSLLASFTTVASAQSASEAEYPRSVFDPPPSAPDFSLEEPEIYSDLGFFLNAGYETPDFNVYYNLRNEVGSNVVIPDFVKRTGQIPPDDVRVEVAAVYLTGGDFNDIVVYSFLPGDCDTGCMTQVYRTADGQTWSKVLEFKSLAFAYRQAYEDKPTEVVAVGGTGLSSRIFTWNGSWFEEKR